MIVYTEGIVRCGAVADLRDVEIGGRSVAAAIRGQDAGDTCAVDCPPPGPVHEHAGYVHLEMGLRTRTALAAAARSRGLSAPQDEELDAVRDRLASMEPPDAPVPAVSSTASASAADEDVDRLRERVAALRGEVRALEAAGGDPSEARDRLRSAARRLSELETDWIGAVQVREQAREHRDRREERLRLEDRAANLERAARAHLVEEVRDAYERAVAALPFDASGSDTDPLDADPVTAALAVLRVATLRAPVVLAVDRFPSPRRAAEWLDAPVIRL